MNDEGRSATAVLRRQHQTIKELLEDLASGPAGARPRLASRLGEELIAHLAAEESIFYPAAQTALLDREAERGRHDHLLMRERLLDVLRASVSGAPLSEPVLALRRAFGRHVLVEETETFPHIERALGRTRLKALGALITGRPTARAVQSWSPGSPGLPGASRAPRRVVGGVHSSRPPPARTGTR